MRALRSVWQGYTTNCLPFSGISKARLEVGQIVVRHFMCLPHGLRDMCMIRLRLLALNEYRSGVINILIGWSIVQRQTIWWENLLVLDMHKMGVARIRGWMIYLFEARWGSRVHLSNSASSGNCSCIDLHYSCSSWPPSLWSFALSWPPCRPSSAFAPPLLHPLIQLQHGFDKGVVKCVLSF